MNFDSEMSLVFPTYSANDIVIDLRVFYFSSDVLSLIFFSWSPLCVSSFILYLLSLRSIISSLSSLSFLLGSEAL